jgi:uncharacterized protein DUF5985
MEQFRILVFAIAPLTSLACMVLLFRGYLDGRQRILLWSALCFVGQAIANAALFVDLVLLPQIDLRPLRLGSALIGMLFLLYGFITESD